MIYFLDVSTSCLSRSLYRPVNLRSPPSLSSRRAKAYFAHFPLKGRTRCSYDLYSTVASRDNLEQSQNMSQKTSRPVRGKPSPPRPSSRLEPRANIPTLLCQPSKAHIRNGNLNYFYDHSVPSSVFTITSFGHKSRLTR